MCEPIQFSDPKNRTPNLTNLTKAVRRLLGDAAACEKKSHETIRAMFREACLHGAEFEMNALIGILEPQFIERVTSAVRTGDPAQVGKELRFIPTGFPVWQKVWALCSKVGLDEEYAVRCSMEYYARRSHTDRKRGSGSGGWYTHAS